MEFLLLYGIIFSGPIQNKTGRKLENKPPDTISILGCGWLGLPLAEYLIEKGYFVNGSTTTSSKIELLKSKGIKPFLIKLDPEINGNDLKEFFAANLLVINIPPSLRKNPAGYHINQISSLTKVIQDHFKKVIFISSTSVYPESEKTVHENDNINTASELFQVEKILQDKWGKQSTILRCGGLMGYERIPGKYFAGKKDIRGGNNPVNYVHRDDVIHIIYEIIKEEYYGDLFNVVAPVHPLKKEVCIKTATDFNMEAPHFQEEKAEKYKIVSSDKIINTLQYSFKYPTPMNFFYKL